MSDPIIHPMRITVRMLAVLVMLMLPVLHGTPTSLAQEGTPASGVAAGVADVPETNAEAGSPTEGRIVIEAAPGQLVDVAAFEVSWGAVLDQAVTEIGAPLPPLTAPLVVTLYADEAALQASEDDTVSEPGASRPAVATADGGVAVATEALLATSPTEATTDLRHAVAHALLMGAGGRGVSQGFAEGFATYVERPASTRVARIAAIVQDGRARSDLLSWSDLNRPRADMSDSARFSAHAYSMVAFLVERYGLRSFGKFVAAFESEPDWRSAMRATYQRPPDDLEAQWREEIPRWTAGGWRENVFPGFDLAPAKEMIASGRYAAAQREVERSLRLFTDLGLTDRQAEAEPILRQAEQGIQAEALMAQVEQALGRHAYDRAGALLTQAETQYAAVPEGLRPAMVIDRYRQMSQQGVQASANLDEAGARSASWQDYPDARAAALAAGIAYAELGDEEMHKRSVSLLHDLDDRQRRLTIVLGVLAALCAVWLALWLWARPSSDLDWGR